MDNPEFRSLSSLTLWGPIPTLQGKCNPKITIKITSPLITKKNKKSRGSLSDWQAKYWITK